MKSMHFIIALARTVAVIIILDASFALSHKGSSKLHYNAPDGAAVACPDSYSYSPRRQRTNNAPPNQTALP